MRHFWMRQKTFPSRALTSVLTTSGFTICLLAPAANVWADPGEGGYVGLRAGLSKNEHACEEAALECDRSDTGYGIYTGYGFNPNLAMELGFTNAGKTSAVYPEVSLEGKVQALDLSAIYSHAIFGHSRLFAKAGLAYWQGKVDGWGASQDDSGFSPVLGLGAQFPFADHLSVRIEYQYFSKVGSDDIGHTQPTLLSLGLTWHFASQRDDFSASPSPSISPPAVASRKSAPSASSASASNSPASTSKSASSSTRRADIGSPTPKNTVTQSKNTGTQSENTVTQQQPAPPATVAEKPDNISTETSQVVSEPGNSTASSVTPETKNKSDGPKKVEPIVIDDHSNSPLFAKGSSVLKINYALEKIAVELLRSPQSFVHIVVHTDDEGSAAQNLQLSKARADKLVDYLQWQGVNPDRITAENKGEADPVVKNTSEVNRARNRRVEFFISESKLIP